MQLLSKALSEGIVLLDLHARDLDEIFRRTLDVVIDRGLLPAEDRERVRDALIEREQRVSTAIGHAVAVPHAYLDCFDEQVVVFVRLAEPLNLGAPDGIPTRFLFLLLGPAGIAAEHLDTLTNIARLMSDDEFRFDAGQIRDADELLEAVHRFQARTTPAAVSIAMEPSAGLRYTGRLFGGLLADVKRRLPHYVSDVRDGLHSKCVASTLFLFFACLAPAVTFGGIMADLTGSHIGAVEMLVGTAVCGITFALVAGQPLIILGATGPMLVITAILFDLCLTIWGPELGGRYFLPTYGWVGLWTAGIILALAATDASCLMRFFTRFTDEIFAALISIIFIHSAVTALVSTVSSVYAEQALSHDDALVPLLLAFGTYYIAMNLSRFRRSRYLHPKMREFLADFGPTIALLAMTLVAVWLHRQVTLDLEELPAPDSFRPTYPPGSDGTPRGWLVNLFDAPRWVWFAAAGPALLVSVLVFVDQNITARLINSPDHKLHKGESYHLDLAVVGGLIGVCSLLGLPWFVAATVRSLNHVRSLATIEEVATPRGDKRERIIHTRENRITPLAIHVLIGCSLLLLPLLKQIPMAVLYGLFLFMGVVSLAGNQFFERLSLWLMDRNLYPSTHYIRRVPLTVIHKFTLLQLAGLVVLWIVKGSPLGIVFPLFIALLVPVRFLAGRWFSPAHLAALDAEEEPEEEETAWV